MIGRLAERARGKGDAAAPHLTQRLGTGVVPWGELPHVAIALRETDPLSPAPPALSPPEHVVDPEIGRPKLGTHADAILELQSLEMPLNRGQVRIVQLAGEFVEESGEPFRGEGRRVLLGDAPQAPEHLDEQLHHVDRVHENRVRGLPCIAPDPPLAFDRLGGECI